MFNLYLFQGDVKEIPGGKETLARICVADWLTLNGTDATENQVEIYKDEKGKPYAQGPKDVPVKISISHTGDIWGILVGDKLCGLDIQYQVKTENEKIADKYFSFPERLYMRAGKYSNQRTVLDGFFNIWTIREAVGKLTGEGFYGEFPSFVSSDKTAIDIVENNGEINANRYRIKDTITYQGNKIKIMGLDLNGCFDNPTDDKLEDKLNDDRVYAAVAVQDDKVTPSNIEVINVDYQEEQGFTFS